MSYLEPARGDFQVGRVLGRSFAVLFGDFLRFFVTALIIWLPFLLLGAFMAIAALHSLTKADPRAPSSAALIVGAIVAIVLFLVLFVLSQAAMVHGAFQKMRGRRFGIGASLARSFARVLPILAMVFLMGLAIFFGALLLIVPAFILSAMWYVALAPCVLEGLGPLASLERSAALTKGHRWKIFGQQFMLLIAGLVLGVLIGVVLNVLGRALGPGATLNTIVNLIVNLVWYAGWIAFGIMILVVTYHDLRVAKEGIGTDQLAAVFE
jgi:hypothetical protein